RQPDGSWAEVPAARLRPGDLVRVRPGERIAADGTISEGQSAIDQSPITGESLPVEKGPDDDVYAGTVNASGSFDYRVTAAAGNTTLDRIIHAVEQAQGARAPTQRFIDRFSRIYTPAVVGLAVLVALAPPLLLGHAWLDSVYRALALLIIACPCALVISTPVSVVSGLTAAARRGILIKGGVYLEEGRKLRWLALDKTGTLTQGKPVQTDLELLHDASAGGRPALRAAVSLAARSD
ncbi:heavy metal translocating P-type ATPase, partial [Bordetella pertussis]